MSGSYVPGFKYDVFVSYAHVDDEAVVGAELGWVSTLQRNLFTVLGRRLGRRENYTPFTDHRLRGHDDIDSLLEAVRDSATLVVILSPGWVESTYCQEELKNFLNRPAGNRPRDIFVVEMLKLTAQRPEGLPNSRDYGFWYEDERGRTHTYGYFNYKDPELDYGKRLDQLAQELADHLNGLRTEALAQLPVPPPPLPGPTPLAPPVPSGPRSRVVLAEVTDDLRAQRADLSTYLRDQNFEILPEGSYRWMSPAQVEAAVTRDLDGSAGFVQLLGETPGHTDDQAPNGMPWLQHRAAKNLGSRIVQWRKPEIDLKSIDLLEYRALVGGETVREMPLHDFMKFVVEFLRPPAGAPAPRPGAVFINADQPDLELARHYKEDLERQFPVVIPSAEGDPVELREMMDEYLTTCDSVVMLYGTTKSTWIDRQLWRFNKLARNREHPPRLLAVLDIKIPRDETEAPPDKYEILLDKPKPSVGLPGLTALSALGIEAGLTLLRQHLAA
jgi:TIR domain